MGRQNIVNYWGFPSRISSNCHRTLIRKFARRDQSEMFVEMSRERLVCFANCGGMTPLSVLFQLPLLNCFIRNCLQTLFLAVLIIFLPSTISAVSGAQRTNNSAPTRFALGNVFTQEWNCSFPNKLCKCTDTTLPFSTDTCIESNLYLF